ncbi:MAG: glycosyltransferase family 2 protein [Flavobacteriaceae bacterium]|nr:glycosyltransferase family 2 protein [Flavobacteriaceae bacterium]
MSLSILIPIYNFDVKNLVNDLHQQCELLDIDFEIILADDCSKSEFHLVNKELVSLSNVTYERLKENVGRSKIRNYLLQKAIYKNCLILDCDVAIVSSDYIEKYLGAIEDNCVIVGGHIYQKNPPKDTSLILHWKYGTQVECKPLSERLKKPYDSFMTNSFLIQKETFKKVKFDESIIRYGHEDTVFGIELKLKKIAIKHIDNPVLHLGIKSAQDFLKGEKESIVNLVRLSNKRTTRGEIIKKSKLLSSENKKIFKAYYYLTFFYYKNRLDKMLLSENPSLRLFTLWKYFNLKELRKSIGN